MCERGGASPHAPMAGYFVYHNSLSVMIIGFFGWCGEPNPSPAPVPPRGVVCPMRRPCRFFCLPCVFSFKSRYGFIFAFWRGFRSGAWVDRGVGYKSRLGVNFVGGNGFCGIGGFHGMAMRLHISTEGAFSGMGRAGTGGCG